MLNAVVLLARPVASREPEAIPATVPVTAPDASPPPEQPELILIKKGNHSEWVIQMRLRLRWQCIAVHRRLICHYCRRPMTNKQCTLDHVRPISLGGEDSPDNVVLACRCCNQQKAAMTLAEWADVLQAQIQTVYSMLACIGDDLEAEKGVAA